MSLFLYLGFFVIGVIILVRAGELTISGATKIAQRYGLSSFLIGFTIIGMGTSLPELVISLNAHLKGAGDLSLGNVIGSNIANILFILGSASLVTPVIIDRKPIKTDIMMLFLVTILLAGYIYMGSIGRFAGAIMVLFLLGYILYMYRMNKQSSEHVIAYDKEEDLIESQTWIPKLKSPFLSVILGMIGIAIGAELLVRGASGTAGILGVPEAVIGLTIVAFGTSLPELTTCLIAARRGESGLLLGNVLGSNVFNVLLILGLTALIKPFTEMDIPDLMREFDVYVFLGVGLGLIGYLMTQSQITKISGILFLLGYILYLGVSFALYSEFI